MYSRNTSMVDYKDKRTNSLLLMPGNTGSSVEYYCCSVMYSCSYYCCLLMSHSQVSLIFILFVSYINYASEANLLCR